MEETDTLSTKVLSTFSRQKIPQHSIKTFERNASMQQSNKVYKKHVKVGQIVKIERYMHHLVATKTAPEELEEFNSIDNIEDLWVSLRQNGFNKKES